MRQYYKRYMPTLQVAGLSGTSSTMHCSPCESPPPSATHTYVAHLSHLTHLQALIDTACTNSACEILEVPTWEMVTFYNSTSVLDDLAWGGVWLYRWVGGPGGSVCGGGDRSGRKWLKRQGPLREGACGQMWTRAPWQNTARGRVQVVQQGMHMVGLSCCCVAPTLRSERLACALQSLTMCSVCTCPVVRRATGDSGYLGQSQKFLSRHYTVRAGQPLQAVHWMLFLLAWRACITLLTPLRSCMRPSHASSPPPPCRTLPAHTLARPSCPRLQEDISAYTLISDRAYYAPDWNNVAWSTNVILNQVSNQRGRARSAHEPEEERHPQGQSCESYPE